MIGEGGFSDVGRADDGNARGVEEPVEVVVCEDEADLVCGEGHGGVSPCVGLGEEESEGKFGSGEGQSSGDLAVEECGAIDGIQWDGVAAMEDVEAMAGGEIEYGLDDPRSAVDTEVRKGGVGVQEDDGIIEDDGAVGEVTVNGAAGGDGSGEMGGEEFLEGRAEEANDGDGACVGWCEEDGGIVGHGGGHQVLCLM